MRLLEQLRASVSKHKSVLIAYSGGIDSALVAKLAFDVLGDKAVALTALSPAFPSYQLNETGKIAQWIGIKHVTVNSNELSNPDYASNPNNRCYFCKSELYSICESKAEELGFNVILNGFNKDDQSDWRPGFKAQQEFSVHSPLLEAGMNKKDVRSLAKDLGMPIWDKPASPCLSSRFPYGTAITKERLEQVDVVESFLYKRGLREFRARFYGDEVKLEFGTKDFSAVQNQNLKKEIENICQQAGFQKMSIDPQGLRSGNLNDALSQN